MTNYEAIQAQKAKQIRLKVTGRAILKCAQDGEVHISYSPDESLPPEYHQLAMTPQTEQRPVPFTNGMTKEEFRSLMKNELRKYNENAALGQQYANEVGSL
jgi:hypothetical protein